MTKSCTTSPPDPPLHRPAYQLGEAARYVKLPQPTLRTWVLGRKYPDAQGGGYFEPLIEPAQREPLALSFANLIEAHVLRALRSDHGVSIKAVRQALRFAEQELGINRLLLDKQLTTHGGRIFLDRYGELIELSASGQLAMREVLNAHLARIEWDERGLPASLYPFVPESQAPESRKIVIAPEIGFGRPVLRNRRVSTRAIVERLDAGETPEELAQDYDLTVADIRLAAIYEQAA